MGQGNTLFYPRPSARSASVPGAGSVLLMFLGPPDNRRNQSTSPALRWATELVRWLIIGPVYEGKLRIYLLSDS